MNDRRDTLRPDRRVLVVVAVLLVVSLLWVVPRALRSGRGDDAEAVPATTAPAASAAPVPLPAPIGQAPAPARLSPPLPAGTVALAAGAFTDRARFERLAMRAGDTPAVTGQVRYQGEGTPDGRGEVVVALQADFYDAAGQRVGAGTFTLRVPVADAMAEEGGTRRAFGFEVPASGPAPTAAAARLAVPTVLVEKP